jgi:hypothetical protein
MKYSIYLLSALMILGCESPEVRPVADELLENQVNFYHAKHPRLQTETRIIPGRQAYPMLYHYDGTRLRLSINGLDDSTSYVYVNGYLAAINYPSNSNLNTVAYEYKGDSIISYESYRSNNGEDFITGTTLYVLRDGKVHKSFLGPSFSGRGSLNYDWAANERWTRWVWENESLVEQYACEIEDGDTTCYLSYKAELTTILNPFYGVTNQTFVDSKFLVGSIKTYSNDGDINFEYELPGEYRIEENGYPDRLFLENGLIYKYLYDNMEE